MYLLTGRWRLDFQSSFVSSLALTHHTLAVGGIVTAFEVGITPLFVNFQKFQVSMQFSCCKRCSSDYLSIKAVVILWLAAECMGDILITGSLVWYL